MLKWKPNYLEFKQLFNNDKTLDILTILFNSERQTSTSAEIAKILDIHISTSSKYLELLEKFNLVKSIQHKNRRGKPTEYKLLVNGLNIDLDFYYVSNTFVPPETESLGNFNPKIIENINNDLEIFYDVNEKGLIRSIEVKNKINKKKSELKKIFLSPVEQKFMKYLPHPSMDPEYFIKICNKAHLTDFINLRKLTAFVKKLQSLEIITIEN